MCARGKELGVAGERDAGIHHHALLHRRGDERVEGAEGARVAATFKQRQYVMGVGGVEYARLCRYRQRVLPNFDDTGARSGRFRVVFGEA